MWKYLRFEGRICSDNSFFHFCYEGVDFWAVDILKVGTVVAYVMEDRELEALLKNTVQYALEMRKGIRACLDEKRERVLSAPVKVGLDDSVWNDLGLYFLSNFMPDEAVQVYSDMLDLTQFLEAKSGHVHKGLALYNMGIAQINLRNYDEGIPNVLKAYEEDKLKIGEAKAKLELAYRVKEGILDFTSQVIDNNYLKDFMNFSRLGANIRTYDLLGNMEEAEKLFFAKIVNSKKLVTFHDNIYTKVLMFDNIKNLCLIIESNLRRRKGTRGLLPDLVGQVFASESWEPYFETDKRRGSSAFINYSSVSDFDSKVDRIEKYSPSGASADDFHLKNFLTATLIRNFTAHYLDEKITLLSNQTKYDKTFARVLWALLYALYFRIR